jgi:hypothetical protein
VAPPPVSTSPARVSLPVRFFLGADDRFAQYLAPQRDSAMRDAAKNGFANVSAANVPGVHHDAMIGVVLAYFDSLLVREWSLK